MLLRSWGFLGMISAVLTLGGFFDVLLSAGWHPGLSVSAGSPLHHAYLQATTMTFLGIVACQIGTAFAARTERASLLSVGVLSNRLLLFGICFEVIFAVALITLPPLRAIFGNDIPGVHQCAVLLLFPFVVWGADELRKVYVRRAHVRVDPVQAA